MLVKIKDLKVGDTIKTGVLTWGTIRSIIVEGNYVLIDTADRMMLKKLNDRIQVKD